MRTLILLCVVAAAYAQYEAGFVKILQDKRYHAGDTFGNFRHQEDGIKYHEETDANGVRRGYWEYPSEGGQILRTEFEAGPGIGFRVTKSNHHDVTPVVVPKPQFQPSPAPVHRPVTTHVPVPVHRPAPVHTPTQIFRQPTPQPRRPVIPPTPMPEFQNLFDYPGNLEFSRSNTGHRFKFTAA